MFTTVGKASYEVESKQAQHNKIKRWKAVVFNTAHATTYNGKLLLENGKSVYDDLEKMSFSRRVVLHGYYPERGLDCCVARANTETSASLHPFICTWIEKKKALKRPKITTLYLSNLMVKALNFLCTRVCAGFVEPFGVYSSKN